MKTKFLQMLIFVFIHAVSHRSLIQRLEKVDPMKMTHEEQLCFWINIHNALVMHVLLYTENPISPFLCPTFSPIIQNSCLTCIASLWYDRLFWPMVYTTSAWRARTWFWRYSISSASAISVYRQMYLTISAFFSSGCVQRGWAISKRPDYSELDSWMPVPSPIIGTSMSKLWHFLQRKKKQSHSSENSEQTS